MTHKDEIAQSISGGKQLEINPALLGKESEVSKRILCIYHGNCLDGFGAAWALRYWMPKAEIEFFGAKYNEPPPNVKNRIVYMVDFSYPREIISHMLEDAATFLLLDHHKSAAENLRDLDDPRRGRIIFDMNRSGAGMSWDYFSRGQRRNPLIDHIEDRDLWRFKLQGTREINAAMFSYPYDMNVWDTLMSTDPRKLFDEGVAIERKHHKDVHELVGETARMMGIGGYLVPVANVPYTLSSDACRVLLRRTPAPFSACYSDMARGRVFSLRSEENGADVSQIAKIYGGGGHLHAAGFTMPIGWEGENGQA
jgi:hypothetical protein